MNPIIVDANHLSAQIVGMTYEAIDRIFYALVALSLALAAGLGFGFFSIKVALRSVLFRPCYGTLMVLHA
jgi:hypothetical protein